MPEKLELTYPPHSLQLTLTVDGVFAFPDEWRTTDEANPNLFTYVARFGNIELTNGKIYARQPTEKELREQEESKKKGGKKEAKKEENPAELERLKEQQLKEEAEDKEKEQLWNSMNEQERFYYTSEDKYKSALLRFEPNSAQKELTEKLYVIFEERVLQDGGEWLYIYKIPTATEEEMAKMKKSKPKNLNLADLNPISVRAWVDLTGLRSTEKKETGLRVKVEQVNATEETPKPNLEKTYVKLSVALSDPLLTIPDAFTTANTIKDPPQPKPVSKEVKCVDDLKQELRLALESLAMEYSHMFAKELNANEEYKAEYIFMNNRKNDNNKRKEQFLYDFNISGKYKVLKERLKRVIVHLCENKFADKMQGAKSFTGITCSVRDQLYSEIYNFLVSSYGESIEELIDEKKQLLREVFVLKPANQSKLTEKYLQSYKQETQEERLMRIVKEYNAVGNFEYGRKLYKAEIQRHPENIEIKYQYSLFCIRNELNNVMEVLSWGYIDKYLEYNKDSTDLKIVYILLMIGSEESKSLRKAWILLRELLEKEPNHIEFLLYAALLTEIAGQNSLSTVYLKKAERSELRNLGKVKLEGKHQVEPLQSEIPNLNSAASYSETLSPEQKDLLWGVALQKFSELGLLNIVDRIKQKISQENSPVLRKQNIKGLLNQQEYKECKEKGLELFNETNDFEVLQLVLRCCDRLHVSEEKESILKQALKKVDQYHKKTVLLNLGHYYLLNQKYGNAKACLSRYLEDNDSIGGFSWQLLGICELKIGNIELAVECFRQSNLCDPFNKEVWIWLAQGYLKLQNLVMVNQCLNSYLQNENEIESPKLQELRQILVSTKENNFYEESIKSKLLEKLEMY